MPKVDGSFKPRKNLKFSNRYLRKDKFLNFFGIFFLFLIKIQSGLPNIKEFNLIVF